MFIVSVDGHGVFGRYRKETEAKRQASWLRKEYPGVTIEVTEEVKTVIKYRVERYCPRNLTWKSGRRDLFDTRREAEVCIKNGESDTVTPPRIVEVEVEV